MFYTSNNQEELFKNIEALGLTQEIIKNEVLIKINLSRPYTKNLPRTDMLLLKTFVDYIYQNGGKCAITEGASGYLNENLVASGFDEMLKRYKIKVIDVDLEDCDEVLSFGEHHYIPKCFQEYPTRIAIPSTSKRENMVFSNNVKLFVGAVPRRMYQLDTANVVIDAPRPKIHQNLHSSVANLFLAINSYSPFQFYVNGGLSFNENIGEFNFSEVFIGNDALELDCHLFKTFFNDCEYPDYLDILTKSIKEKAEGR